MGLQRGRRTAPVEHLVLRPIGKLEKQSWNPDCDSQDDRHHDRHRIGAAQSTYDETYREENGKHTYQNQGRYRGFENLILVDSHQHTEHDRYECYTGCDHYRSVQDWVSRVPSPLRKKKALNCIGDQGEEKDIDPSDVDGLHRIVELSVIEATKEKFERQI